MDQPHLFPVEPITVAPAVTVETPRYRVECVVYSDGRGTLTWGRYDASGLAEGNLEIVSDGTSPWQWVDRFAAFASTRLADWVDPF